MRGSILWKWMVLLWSTLTFAPPLGGAQNRPATPVPPAMRIVYSGLVDAQQYTAHDGRYDLFSYSFPTGRLTRLTDHQKIPNSRLGGAIAEPAFSPNGKSVLFLADFADSPEAERQLFTDAAPGYYAFRNIWHFDLATNKITPVTRNDGGWNSIQWAPNGKQFAALCPNEGMGVYSIDNRESDPPDAIFVFDGPTLKGRKLFIGKKRLFSLRWSGDSSILFFQYYGDSTLYEVALAKGKVRVASRMPADAGSYVVSPNRQYVAYVRQWQELHIQSLSSAFHKRLLRAHNPQGFLHTIPALSLVPPLPVWSPDSKYIALTEQVYGHAETRLAILQVTPARKRYEYTFSEPLSVQSWSQDGKWLIGLMGYPGVKLCAISVETGQKVVLMNPTRPTKGLDWREVTP